MEVQSTKITKAVLKNKEWGIDLSDIMILLSSHIWDILILVWEKADRPMK